VNCDFHLSRTPNGTVLAIAPMPWMASVSVGIWIIAGGRYERASQSGVSHFVEHMLFKGTRRRSSLAISEEIEGAGGDINAMTGEENTCYYAKAHASKTRVVADVLHDMYACATMPAAEVERERGVIREEIQMYQDQPSQCVQEHLQNLLWPGHALGRSVTGTLESVSGISRSDLLHYRDSHYIPNRTVVAVSGAVDPKEFPLLWQEISARRKIPDTAGASRRGALFRERHGRRKPDRVRVLRKPVEQAHVALGFHTFAREDHRRFALRLLNVVAGENMSSRLFQEVRERRGLAYAVSSGVLQFHETGAFSVSAGLESSKVPETITLILKVLGKLASGGISSKELCRAKDYALGTMWMSLENTSSRMMWLGETLTTIGRVVTPQEIEAGVRAVTASEIKSLACELFVRGRARLAVVAPDCDENSIRQSLQSLG